MKKYLLIAFLFIASIKSKCQTVFYSEDFQSGGTNWNLNVVTGIEGQDPNFFTVSDNEGGVIPPGCGTAGNGDKTLHITSVFNPTGGASYDAGGLCGLLFCPLTNRRAESPVINCTGQSSITLSFDFISQGQGLTDNASVWYFDGANWSVINNSIKSSVCGNGQGSWTNLSINLPTTANNNPNIKIGFKWVNNDDGVGTDPSLAVNNIKLTSVSAPSLSLNLVNSSNLSCFGSNDGSASVSINGGTLPYSIDWLPGNPAGDGTNSISGLSAGTYTCMVTDGNGTSDSVVVTISSPNPIITSQVINICYNQNYSIGNNTYNSSGTYSDTLQTLNGCDSIIITNLTVGNPINTNVNLAGSTLLATQGNASYQWWNCANGGSIIPNATNQFFSPTTSGGYAVVITQNGCSDTSACFDITVIGITENSITNHSVFPNPFTNELSFNFDQNSPEKIEIISGLGMIVKTITFGSSSKTRIETKEFGSGVYYYRCIWPNGETIKGMLIKSE